MCEKTSSHVTQTSCVSCAHFQCVLTRWGIYKWTASKRHVIEVTFHSSSILTYVFRRVLKHCKFWVCEACKCNVWICALATDRDLESCLSKSTSVRTRKGELCLMRATSGETLVVAIRDTDVQTVQNSSAMKRKTNRPI